MTKVLLATHNKSKIQRFKSKLALEGLEFVTLEDLSLEINEPEENGINEWENAKIKAKAYFDVSGLPSLAEDTGLYFLDLPPDKQPGKDVKSSAGVLATDSGEIKFKKMTDFYINIANSLVGQAEAYFLDEYCLYNGKEFKRATGKRYITVTNKVNKVDINFPICSLYSVKSSGKHYQELNDLEMEEFLKPSIDGARNILKSLLD